MTGYATSVIGCGCEAGIERELEGEATPDGRPGVSVLVFAISREELAKQVERRVGQCVLTSPTSAAYSGLDGDERIDLGRKLRYFGDGFQTSKLLGARRYWRIPVMDGEFVCEETAGVARAIGGGNLLIVADGVAQALAACEAAIAAMRDVGGVIMLGPGGGYQVIEVNSIPAWRGLQSVTESNIAEGLVNDFVSRRLTARLAAVG